MTSSNTSKILLVGLICFLIGLVIGLVVLGWGLWPVQWTGGGPEILDPSWQDNFLRSAIDSYSTTGNAPEARVRYESLGKNGPTTLANIAVNPGQQDPAEIQAFSEAVGLGLSEGPPAEGPQPTASALLGSPVFRVFLGGICLVAVLAILGLLLALVLRSRGKKTLPDEPETPAIETYPEAEAPVYEQAPLQEETIAPSEDVPTWLFAEDQAAPGVDQETTAFMEQTDADLEGPDFSEEIAARESESQPPAPAEPSSGAETIKLGPAAAAGAAAAAYALRDDGEAEMESPAPAEPSSGAETIKLGPTAAAGAVAAAYTLGEDGEAEMQSPTPAAAPFGVGGLEEDASPVFPADTVAAPAPAAPAAPFGMGGFEEEPAAVAAPVQEAGYDIETDEEMQAKFAGDIRTIQGVGGAYGNKLKAAGIGAPVLLLQRGSSPQGRKEIADKSGITHTLILKWVNHADLMRVRGISPDYAELLEAAGVDTVVELSMRNPTNLHEKIEQVNQEKNLARQTPPVAQVQDWIAQAKELPRVITY